MKVQYTDLRTTLLEHLSSGDYSCKEAIERRVTTTPLTLAAIQYRGYIFTSDLNYTIQMVLPETNTQEKKLTVATDPLNILENGFYPKINKTRYDFWQPYSTPCQELYQTTQYPHPYCPEFFLNEFFQDFIMQRRQNKPIKISSRIVRITQWRVRIVNVSSSGWYAPVIEPISHKYDTTLVQTFKEDYKQSSLILYEENIKGLMESLRLTDMKISKKHAKGQMLPFSLALYTWKNTNEVKPRSNMCDVDHTNEYLNFNKDTKISYLPFGPLSGTMTLTSMVNRPPLNKDILLERHMKQLQETFNNGSKIVEKVNRKTAEQRMEEDWDNSDSEEESSEYQIEDDRKGLEIMIDEDDEESQDDEDVLKKLYKAQLGLNSLKLI